MDNFQELIKSAISAKGIPDRAALGNPLDLKPGNLYDYVIQRHLADRAGPHFDIRFGPEDAPLYSFASRYLAQPGEKRLAVQQPLHDSSYKDFEGTIPEGYGKGTVSTHDLGKILVTKTTPGTLHFTVAHTKYPERFVLVKGTGKNWLLVNTTPTEQVPEQKLKYKILPESQVEDVLQGQYSISPKIDGASTLVKLMKDNVDLFSYRTSVTGKPWKYW
jgi:bifunctional non-homologous end joining protein LigD